MRPGDFSPGNIEALGRAVPADQACFNEAGGFLPRKHLGRQGHVGPRAVVLQ